MRCKVSGSTEDSNLTVNRDKATMQAINIDTYLESIKTRKAKDIKSERSGLIKEFIDNLNPERVERGLKPLSPAYVSMVFADAQMDNWDIGIFLGRCKEAKNFGACFWSNLKGKAK